VQNFNKIGAKVYEYRVNRIKSSLQQ